MRRLPITVPFIIFLVFSKSVVAFAEVTPDQSSLVIDPTGHSIISAGTKIIKNSFSTGTLIGGNYKQFESDAFSIGGAAYTGQLSTGTVGNFSYGGLLVGFHKFQTSTVQLEVNVIMGGGGGTSDQGVGGGAVFEPSVGTNIIVGKATRMSLALGYLWIPSSTKFSGGTLGLRVDFMD
jgi:hypothetical protein